ncbi:MAG: thiamine pyrophosphate-binding protein [Vulcanimicrobiaceae bacterium]
MPINRDVFDPPNASESAPAPRDAARKHYGDQLMSWLQDLGYTHCFFVAGAEIVHLLDGARSRFHCVPFVQEVAGAIAAEYFNAAEGRGRAFVLVGGGAGFTNVVTAMAAAYCESRELLVIGGQVNSTDLAGRGLRQRGVHEVDGVAVASRVTVVARRIEAPIAREAFSALVERGRTGRKGPVFLEICLDAQIALVDEPEARPNRVEVRDEIDSTLICEALERADEVAAMLSAAERPILLLGNGVSRRTARAVLPKLRRLNVPIQTTWNGIDRIPADEDMYFGRPNAQGQRYANVLLQQADLVLALGTRLSLAQTGPNWREFAPLAKVVQVDIDRAELEKGHPRLELALRCDANTLLREISARNYPDYAEWFQFCRHVRAKLPLHEEANAVRDGFVDPYGFYRRLSEVGSSADVIVLGSNGVANVVAMQALRQRIGQVILTNKSLAPMGHGLAGAVGAAMAWPEKRTILIEGDASLLRSAQELGTVALNKLNLKIFVFANDGHGSLRAAQRQQYGGAYLGCDAKTGFGLPVWTKLFDAFGIPVLELEPDRLVSAAFERAFESAEPHAFVVPLDPRQTFHPKLSRKVASTDGSEFSPLHQMAPELPAAVAADVLRYLSAPAELPEPTPA